MKENNKNYSNDIIMQGFARISGGLLSFLAIFVLTYLFNESELGKYNLILTTINVITSVSTLWLSQSILRYYQDKKQVGSLLYLMIICAVVSLALFEGYVLLSASKHNIWAYIYVIVLVVYNVLDSIFRKSRRLSYYVGLELLLAVGRLFPMVVLARITHDYNSIFLSQVITILLFLIITIINEKDTLIHTNYRVHKEDLLKYLRFGFPLVGLSISNWFLTTSDRYVIKYFGNDANVGIYSTNYSLGNSIYMMFSLILVNAMHPIIMDLWERNHEEAIKTVSNTINLYLLFMSPLVFYGCLKASILLGMFKGVSYSAHSSIFVWTVLGIFIYGIALLLHKYYECIQKTNNILFMNIIAAVFNIIANIILIPVFGFGVAAFTTFLSYVLYAIIVWFRIHKFFPVKVSWTILFRIILSITLFGMVDWMLIKNNSVLLFFIEGAIYVLYTLLFYQLFGVYNVKHSLNKFFNKR